MDGPIRLGQRSLWIEFQFDRHTQDRIELAYRRIEMPAIVTYPSEDSVQVASLEPLTTATYPLEIQG